MARKRFSKEDIERLFRGVLHEKKNISQAAEELGMTRESAQATLKGRIYVRLRPDLTPEEELKLKDLRITNYEVRGNLTEEQVRAIYKEHVHTDVTPRQLAEKFGVKVHVIKAIVEGQNYYHIFNSLPIEERIQIVGANNRKKDIRSSVTSKKLNNAERDYKILISILSSPQKSYRQIAEEADVDPSYISLLLKGKRGRLAWDMLTLKEKELITKISINSKFRESAVKEYLEVVK